MNKQVFENKTECCGCGACQAICPKNAIEMVEDEYGFIYPRIDESKCVNCNLCKKTCAYMNPRKMNDEKKVYASVSKNDENLKRSASGGVFYELANSIISDGGVVYGCSMEYKNDKLTPKHIRVNNQENLKKLQGSKYVQSECGNIYKLVKTDLINGKKVLFSGTPCQIEGVKSFLQYKEYENLFLVDIICHGVPSRKMFQDYIENFEIENNCKVKEFYFRDKDKGWGLFFKVVYEKNGKTEKTVKPSYESSFYQLFLDSSIYRENCYKCPYATENRNSDLTIGDFWGIGQEHPDVDIDSKRGISCIIANSNKGKKIIEKYSVSLYNINSNFEKVARHNHQLSKPSKHTSEREKILELYKNGTYDDVDNYYKKTRRVKNMIKKIRDVLKGSL